MVINTMTNFRRRFIMASTLLGGAIIAIACFLATSYLFPTDSRLAEFRTYGFRPDNQQCTVPCTLLVKEPMTLGEFIKAAGSPEKIYGGVESERMRVWFYLFYFDRGYYIIASGPGFYNIEGNIEPRPDLEVERLDLWNSRNIADMKVEISRTRHLNLPLERAQDWNGFVPIQPLKR